MRKKLLVTCGLFAVVGLITVATVLGTARIGKAASKNTCTLVNSNPDCLSVGVFPGQLNATTGQGLIVAKFVNQGSATATHTVLKVTLPSTVMVDSVTPTPSTATCSGTTSPITCSFGNVAGLGTAKVSIVFKTTLTAPNTLLGSDIKARLTYAEGNDNTGTPSNDQFDAIGNDIRIVDGTFVDGASGAGTCTNNAAAPAVSTVLGGSGQTQINSLSSLLSGFPCTPIAGGVLSNDKTLFCGAAKCTSPFSFVILPTTGKATLIIPVSTLANGMNASKFTLYWFSETGTIGIPLKKCSDTQGLKTPGTDTCIQSQTDVKIGNVKYISDVLTVFGVSLIDSKYAG